jgi:hypothetical protein
MLTYADVCDAWQPGMYATKRLFFFSHTFENPEIESEFLESHVYIARLRCSCECECECECDVCVYIEVRLVSCNSLYIYLSIFLSIYLICMYVCIYIYLSIYLICMFILYVLRRGSFLVVDLHNI